MKNNPLVSIIVPVYKVEEFLDECVNSILCQTYGNIEIILVDDGSPDNCPLICDNYVKVDQRVRVVHKKNGGLSSARNAGLDIARGTFIGFVDSDDFIEPNMIELLLKEFEESNNIAIVTGQIRSYYNGIYSDYRPYWNHHRKVMIDSNKFVSEVICEKESFTVWNKLYRRDVIGELRFREGFNNEDTFFMFDLSFKLLEQNLSMVSIPNLVYNYRKRDGSICNSVKKPLDIDVIRNIEIMMAEANGKIEDKILKRYYYYRVILFVKRILSNPYLYDKFYSQYNTKLRNITLKDYLSTPWDFKYSLYFLCEKMCPKLFRFVLMR